MFWDGWYGPDAGYVRRMTCHPFLSGMRNDRALTLGLNSKCNSQRDHNQGEEQEKDDTKHYFQNPSSVGHQGLQSP